MAMTGTTEYYAPGQDSLIPYANTGSAIAAGDIVNLVTGASGFVGRAQGDIAATTGTGTLQVRGIITVPKATGEAMTVGQTVYSDGTNASGTNTTTSTRLGRVVNPAASAATTVQVMLNQA